MRNIFILTQRELLVLPSLRNNDSILIVGWIKMQRRWEKIRYCKWSVLKGFGILCWLIWKCAVGSFDGHPPQGFRSRLVESLSTWVRKFVCNCVSQWHYRSRPRLNPDFFSVYFCWVINERVCNILSLAFTKLIHVKALHMIYGRTANWGGTTSASNDKISTPPQDYFHMALTLILQPSMEMATTTKKTT